MSKLQLVKLETTSIQLVDGDRGVNYPSKKDFSGKGYCLFLDSSNLTRNGFDFSTTVFIDKKKDEQMGKGHLQRGDLVINTRGTIGNIGYYSDDVPFENIRINSGMLILRGGSDYSNRFLYFYLRSGLVFSQIDNLMSGSVQNQLPIWVIKFLKLPKIDIKYQNKISDVLSALDAKIDLNNRINAELEAMAKTLYDYWFVQFDFPDKNGKPYKSSGGKMVWNKELKREIPEGWTAGSLVDLGDIVGGSTPSTTDQNNFFESGTPWITPKDLANCNGNKFISKGELGVTAQGMKSASLKLYPKGTVLLSSRAPIGYMAIARNPVTTNQGFKSIIPNKGYSSQFVYYTLKNSMKTIVQYASGSTFKEVSGTVLKTVLVCLPKSSIVDTYTKTVASIFDRQDILELENQHLSSLRDWLLPMLMNGQVKVS